jgi:hypothetical protein
MVWVVKKNVVRILEFERDPEGINHFIVFENTHPELEMPKVRRSRIMIERELEQAHEDLKKAEEKTEETNSLNRGADFSIPEDMAACFAACAAKDKVRELEAELKEEDQRVFLMVEKPLADAIEGLKKAEASLARENTICVPPNQTTLDWAKADYAKAEVKAQEAMERWLALKQEGSDKRRCMEDDCRHVHDRLEENPNHAELVAFSQHIAKRYKRDWVWVKRLIRTIYEPQEEPEAYLKRKPIRKDRW